MTKNFSIFILNKFNTGGTELFNIAPPNLYLPAFSWQAMVELVVPLAITVLVVQNGQGFAVLNAAGHQPPVNAITGACGAGSMVTALVGTVSTCLTGPVNAIISSSGEKSRHYTAGVMVEHAAREHLGADGGGALGPEPGMGPPGVSAN